MIDPNDLLDIKGSSGNVVAFCADPSLSAVGVMEMAMSLQVSHDFELDSFYPEIRDTEIFRRKRYVNPTPCSDGRLHWFLRLRHPDEQPD